MAKTGNFCHEIDRTDWFVVLCMLFENRLKKSIATFFLTL